MRTLGLIGGTTWLSTIDYYRYLNQLVEESLGGSSSANLLLYSVNFSEYRAMAEAGDWAAMGERTAEIAVKLENAGADAIVLCANTLHIVVDRVREDIDIPVIYIVDCVAGELTKQNVKKVGLLGTKFTMESDFYPATFTKFGIETIIPAAEERAFIHSTILDELGKEIFLNETKQKYLEIIDDLGRQGAEGIVLGCTEIPLMIRQEDHSLPLFDTTLIHANNAVDFALA